jgi:hypothetical protein
MESKQIGSLKIVISDSINFRMPERIREMKAEYEKKRFNFELELVWNHTKIALIKCKENYYVIEGSGNYSDNSEIEQYRFENNKQSYDFHKDWIEKQVFEKRLKKRHEIMK